MSIPCRQFDTSQTQNDKPSNQVTNHSRHDLKGEGTLKMRELKQRFSVRRWKEFFFNNKAYIHTFVLSHSTYLSLSVVLSAEEFHSWEKLLLISCEILHSHRREWDVWPSLPCFFPTVWWPWEKKWGSAVLWLLQNVLEGEEEQYEDGSS